MQGWIKLHRKLLESSIFKKESLLQLFLYCLLKANHEPKKVVFNGKEININIGQFITGREVMANDLKQKSISAYKRLKTLQNLGILNIESNNKFTIVTVVNYELYQDKSEIDNNKINNQGTTKEQPRNNQGTQTRIKRINKNYNKLLIYTSPQLKILEYWNSKNIITHETTAEMQKHIQKAIDRHGTEKIIQAIDNYTEVYFDEKYFYSCKWRLDKFLKQSNGLPEFLEDGQQWINYIDKKRDFKVINTQKTDDVFDKFKRIYEKRRAVNDK